jgi:hypothetical protein
MDLQRYIFFDPSSGEILATHTHVSMGGEWEPPTGDDLRQLYRSFPGQEGAERVDVLSVDEDLLGRGRSAKRARVDPKARQIVWPENGGG